MRTFYTLVVLVFTSTLHLQANPRIETIRGRSVEPQSSPTDLRHLWPEGSIRDQAQRGSCHTFATVGLIEAGLAWEEISNRISQKEKDSWLLRGYTDLSEFDLFSQHFFKNEKASIDDIAKRYVNASFTSYSQSQMENSVYVRDGGLYSVDWVYVKNNGLALESDVPYEFDEYSSNQSTQWRAIRKHFKDAYREVWSDYENQNLEDKLTYFWSNKRKKLWNHFTAHIKEPVSKIKKEWKAGIELDRSVQVRQHITNRLKKFHFTIKTIHWLFGHYTSRSFCAALKKHTRKVGLPVAIAIQNYQYLLYGGEKGGLHGMHAVIFAGYKPTPNGDIAYIRNSWGGTKYDEIPMDKMCQNTWRAAFMTRR